MGGGVGWDGVRGCGGWRGGVGWGEGVWWVEGWGGVRGREATHYADNVEKIYGQLGNFYSVCIFVYFAET